MGITILKDGGDKDLESDVIRFLKSNTKDGGWFAATLIGLNVGFDRNTAAANVRGVLNRLAYQGRIEADKSEKPIIYRWTRNQSTDGKSDE